MRARLADAKFFFDQDRKKTLESRLPLLAKVVYHDKLGSQGERVERVRASRARSANMLGGAARTHVERAARLAKADLRTEMVGEFPELQGVMGRYYAQHDGEPDDVADAIEDHYRPRFADDDLPATNVGIASRWPTSWRPWSACSASATRPTGDKDPFALRRHALGVIRMLVEARAAAGAAALLSAAAQAFAPAEVRPRRRRSRPFVYDRLRGYLREQGYSAHEVEAVVSLRPPRWANCRATGRRARLRRLPEAATPGRGQQAHRQHPEARATCGPPPASMPRC